MRIAPYSRVLYFSLYCCALVLIINYGCQKKSEPTSSTEKTITTLHPYFTKEVGGPIDRATAAQYKQNLAKKLSQQKGISVVPTVYYLPAADLEKLIRKENTVGICFYFGQDSSGGVHVMPVGVDAYGAVMPTSMVNTTGGIVSWATAKAWSSQFKRDHLGNVWAHFWGNNAVKWLLEQGTELVRIELGVNEADEQKMIFSNAALENPDTGDMTSTCPPHCPSGFDDYN